MGPQPNGPQGGRKGLLGKIAVGARHVDPIHERLFAVNNNLSSPKHFFLLRD
jgi:hypothetical protein